MGSEMCIRDRVRPIRTRHTRTRHTHTRLVHTLITRIAGFERLQHNGTLNRRDLVKRAGKWVTGFSWFATWQG